MKESYDRPTNSKELSAENKPRKRNPSLAALLLTIGALTHSPAHASESGAGRFASPQLIKKVDKVVSPKKVPTKEWKVHITKEDKSGLIKRIESVSGAEVAEQIEEIENELKPDGALMRAFHDSHLSKERFGSILNRLSAVAGQAYQVEAGVISPHEKMQKYLLSKTPRGLVSLEIPVRSSTGAVLIVQCGGQRVSLRGMTAILTDKHCIQYKGYTPAESDEWFLHPDNVDLAMKRIEPDAKEAVMAFDERESTYRGGRFAKADAVNKFGSQTEYYTFIIPMTQPVLSLLYPNLKLTESDKEMILDSGWHVAPPVESTLTALNDKEVPLINAKGQSGTAFFRRTQYGFVLGGPLYLARHRPRACEDTSTALCTSVLINNNPARVVELFDLYKSHWGESVPPKNRLPGGHYTKVFDRDPDTGLPIKSTQGKRKN